MRLRSARLARAFALLLAVPSATFLALQIGKTAMPLEINSSAFSSGGKIPPKYTCDGPDVSPPLKWSGAPAETQSFGLIMDDPDAPGGTWVHWVVYDLPGNSGEFSEAIAKQEKMPQGGAQGKNSFGKIGYGGPCPPPGTPHRYFFKLYALKEHLKLGSGADKAAVERAMQGKILAQGELMGRYGR